MGTEDLALPCQWKFLAVGGTWSSRVWHYGMGFIGALQLQKFSVLCTRKDQFDTTFLDANFGPWNVVE